MSNGIGIIGGGGHADEVESYLKTPLLFRAADKQYLNEKITVDVSEPREKKSTPVHIAVGAPRIRRELEKKWPGSKYVTIISEFAIVDSTAEVGEGSLLAPFSVLTTNVKIGKHVVVNVGSSLQHGTRVGNYVTIGPGVNIGGNVIIGDGVFVGIGATIANGVVIASGVVVGAGATVIRDAEIENGVYVGTPAVFIKENKEWLDEI